MDKILLRKNWENCTFNNYKQKIKKKNYGNFKFKIGKHC